MTHKLLNNSTYLKKFLTSENTNISLFTKLYPAKISNTFTVHLSFDLIKHASEVVNMHFKAY